MTRADPALRARPFRTAAALASCGSFLGVVQIAPALGLEGPWVPSARLLGTVGLLGLAYALWCHLRGLWSALGGGFIFGLTYFGVTLHWLGSSANPDPNTFVVQEVILAAGALCLFVPWWALWFMGARTLAGVAQSGAMGPIAFATAFLAANLLLGDQAMGLPMAPLSLVALDTPAALLLPVLGQFGLDAVLVLTGTMLGHSCVTRATSLGLAGTVIMAILTVLPHNPTVEASRPGTAELVYLAQPSLPHPSMLPPDDALGIVHGTLRREVEAGVEMGARLIVLPEGAFLADLTSDAELVAEVAELLPEGTVVLAGFKRVVVEGSGADFWVRPYNSAILIGSEGVLAVHDKAHLVPFGETMPALFFRLGFDVVAGPSGGYGRGPAIGVLEDVAGLPPFALLICYEAMLSGAVSRETAGAEWLLNISAETLFRGTIGPRFLLEHARMRSVETGRPMLRATAHAFSALISAKGEVQAVLPAEAAGGVSVAVPAARPTLFSRAGYRPLHLTLAGLLGLFVMQAIRSQMQSRLARRWSSS